MAFKPRYSISPDVLSAIAEIAEIKTIVERSRVLPLNEMQLKRQAMVRMVHTSTTIEGNKLAEYQVDRVLSGMSISADERSIKEVKNYLEALKEMEKILEKGEDLTISNILKLHSIILKDLHEEESKIGFFRPGDIYIVDELGSGKEILRYKGPEARDVEPLLRELLAWLKKSEIEKLYPVLKAGLFHSQFVHIHPFADGNGRLTRLLTNFLLYKDGWDFRKVLVLEDFYNENIPNYKNALGYGWEMEYEEGADFTPWLEYFVAGFLVEARKVRDKITALGFDRVKESEEQTYLDQDEVKIMDLLTVQGRIVSDDIVKLLKIAKRTSQLKLKNLIEKSLIKSEGKGPSTYYLLANEDKK